MKLGLTPDQGSVFLCMLHWAREMHWREQRNRELSEDVLFDILPFPGPCKETTT